MMIVPRQPACSVSSGGSISAPALCPSCSTAMRSLIACLWSQTAFERTHPYPRTVSLASTRRLLGKSSTADAFSWLKAGKTYEEIATENAIPTARVRKAIRYAFLAPDIVRAIVEGRQPVRLTSSYLLHHPLPDDWEEQRALVATL